ncbi:S8 family serine peptidase [Nocardioides limicola]|uniref:S8 family serine peptidase n=1 Tax=Nocardioides limicola TaxID=2803368 RepID=UPI00193B2D7F|nr:S8 family serine peptidase [Nocardioides sp. DJM-14]
MAAAIAAATLAIPVPAQAGTGSLVDCSALRYDDDVMPASPASNPPLAALGVTRAHELLRADGLRPGAGIGIAVIGGGVRPTGSLEVAHAEVLAGGGPPQQPTATIVAALAVGTGTATDGVPLGLAPQARALSVRVFDSDNPRDGEAALTTDRVARGLNWVADQAAARRINVVAVPHSVAASDTLEQAVRRVQRAGVLVVAAAGQDAHPANYDGVLAVAAMPERGRPLPEGSDIAEVDLMAPTAAAVATGLNGARCQVSADAAEYAVGVVAGAAALTWTRHADDNAAQIAARLRHTASGASGTRGPVTGAGMVQPVEALTRPLRPAPDGSVDQLAPVGSEAATVQPPPPADDVYAPARESFLWWGLLAGGALLLVLLARPLLRRGSRPGAAVRG